MTNMSSYYLGIDTGGTYTDGVLFDPQVRKVIRSTKVLTTHNDLKICIAQVLEQLLADQPGTIVFVSLSTTLATNAIVEGKKKPVALLLLGYDPELVHKFNFHQEFGTEHYFFVQGKHNLNGVEQASMDPDEVARIAAAIHPNISAFAVSSYAGPANSSHEQAAAGVIAQLTHQPIVQAHHLSSALDSIQRATTASLNASLLSNIHEFLDAVRFMLADCGVECPIMVVRGDGSIVKAEFARQRPVELIHSGPATSAIGGQYLAGVDTALVIDMGGTTTDLSLVSQGSVQLQESNAVVGPYRTCIQTIKAHSFGLGGDSLIAFDHWQNLSIEPDRVVPISRLCSQHPEIKGELLNYLDLHPKLHYSDELEYWILRAEPQTPIEDPKVRTIIELLHVRPQRLWDLKKKVGSIPPMLVRELINHEIIDRSGLTPTDIIHATGEFLAWDREIAQKVCQMAAETWGDTLDGFVQRVKRMMTAKMVGEIIQFLSQRPLSKASEWNQEQSLDRWLFEESLTRQSSYLGCNIFLKIPVVGIGAPARTFLPAVAEALGVPIIFPDHYEVANAVGTVVGNVIIRHEGDVFPCVEGASITGYFSRTMNVQEKFATYEEAMAFARENLLSQVTVDIRVAGAETFVVECDTKNLWDGMSHLSAWAIGKPSGNGKAAIN